MSSSVLPTRTFGVLSSFPPTPCGLATFSAALCAGLVASGRTVDVVRCGEVPLLEDSSVVATLDPDLKDAVKALNRTDVAVIQHEYGLYDGVDGDSVLALLAALTVPTIVVAHTVLEHPTAGQRAVLQQVCAAADAVVVMTESARARLTGHFSVDASTVQVIAHGATVPPPFKDPDGTRGRTQRLLSWGLIGPGKGIEWAIDAMAQLEDLRPHPTYLVAGATHPKVLARSGEAYREMLVRRVRQTGTAPWVTFDDTYRDLASLTRLIRSADLVVLPYDSKDQVTSGVLVDAVAAGRPVVSTAFPHAVELLGSGAGIVVPQRDPAALAAAIRTVLCKPNVASAMAAEARRLAPSLSWAAVASGYDRLADRLLATEPVPA